jgi:hypothetical protein
VLGAEVAADADVTNSGAPRVDALGLTGTPRDIVEPTLTPPTERLTEDGAAAASAPARSIEAESTPVGSTASEPIRRDTIDRPATGNDSTEDEIDGDEFNNSRVERVDCICR